MAILMVVCVLAIIWTIIVSERNNKVFNYRERMRNAIDEKSIAMIDAPIPFNIYDDNIAYDVRMNMLYEHYSTLHNQIEELYNAFSGVSYHVMVHKFWVPVEDFYKGTILEHMLENEEK